MKISAEGMAAQGLKAIRARRDLYSARAAISAFHDALLAVSMGKFTPEQVKEFFCFDGDSKFIGGVISFTERKETE